MIVTTPDPAALFDRQSLLANSLAAGWPDLGIAQLPRVSCAAAVGNATQENAARSITPGTLDHGSNGLFQWRLDRLTAMQDWCNVHFGRWGSIEPQAAFFAYECAKDYPTLWVDLTAGIKTLANLTANIMAQFERPAAASAMLDQRIAYAQTFLNKWPVAPKPSPAPKPVPVPPADDLVALTQIWTIMSGFDLAAQKRMVAYLTAKVG